MTSRERAEKLVPQAIITVSSGMTDGYIARQLERAGIAREREVVCIAEAIEAAVAEVTCRVDWRTCHSCSQSWPHPAETSGMECPSCRSKRARQEEREACALECRPNMLACECKDAILARGTS